MGVYELSSFSMLSKEKKIHMVGIKGTGMCALAEFLHHEGFSISGSDTTETFYTDEILKKINIVPTVFSENNIESDIQLVIYSAAYGENNPEIKKAKLLNIPLKSYPEMLGLLSENRFSAAICGVHGKTTTTGMAGSITKALQLPAAVIAGSAITAFNNSSVLHEGNKYLIAETCEYRRHFLNYAPSIIVLTSVETDHQDYYPDYASIRDGFIEFCMKLPHNGILIYCRDDYGAHDVAQIIKTKRSDIVIISYGFSSSADVKITKYYIEECKQYFSLNTHKNIEFCITIPGTHSVLNATAALLVNSYIYSKEKNTAPRDHELHNVINALSQFSGAKRRSEFLGVFNNIALYDDYGHHPTAILKTIRGFKDFFPEKRLVVDFMSHTYSRTKALFNEFAHAFMDADIIITHKIYASAREPNDLQISGKHLADAIAQTGKIVYFFEEPLDAVPFLANFLKSGDIFITMGAGNNWQVGTELIKLWSNNHE